MAAAQHPPLLATDSAVLGKLRSKRPQQPPARPSLMPLGPPACAQAYGGDCAKPHHRLRGVLRLLDWLRWRSLRDSSPSVAKALGGGWGATAMQTWRKLGALVTARSGNTAAVERSPCSEKTLGRSSGGCLCLPRAIPSSHSDEGVQTALLTCSHLTCPELDVYGCNLYRLSLEWRCPRSHGQLNLLHTTGPANFCIAVSQGRSREFGMPLLTSQWR